MQEPQQILVVEDDPARQELVEDILALLHPHVVQLNAKRIEEARDHLSHHSFALVLLDLNLPDSEGIDGLRRIREVAPEVPVIVLTGMDDPNLINEVLSLGADDFLNKADADARTLLRSVRSVTSRAEMAELRRRERGLRQLADNAEDVFWMIDLKDRSLVFVNRAYEKMFGRSAASMEKNPLDWLEAVHPDDKPALVASFGEEATRESGEFVFRVVLDGAKMKWVKTRNFVIRDDAGTPYRLAGILEDVTDEKTSEDLLNQSFDQLRRADRDRRALLGHLVSAQEEERRRIAGDIHDDSVQVMSAVAMRLEAMQMRLERGEQLPELSDLQEIVRSAVDRLRQLMFDLMPPALEREGLVPALRAYLENAFSGRAVQFEIQNRLESEPETQTGTVLYRIAVEAINNVRKHAGASNLKVEVSSLQGGILVRVSDDGSGFELTRQGESPKGHLGITSMRERAELASGWFRMESEPGRGTTTEFWVPRAES